MGGTRLGPGPTLGAMRAPTGRAAVDSASDSSTAARNSAGQQCGQMHQEPLSGGVARPPSGRRPAVARFSFGTQSLKSYRDAPGPGCGE